jgi:hypothetical protein
LTISSQSRHLARTVLTNRRPCEAEFGQLAADPPMAPARILASQPQHERAHLGWDGRAPALAGRLSPLSAHERAMPAQ